MVADLAVWLAGIVLYQVIAKHLRCSHFCVIHFITRAFIPALPCPLWYVLKVKIAEKDEGDLNLGLKILLRVPPTVCNKKGPHQHSLHPFFSVLLGFPA